MAIKKAKIFTITSAKGGVGKTTVTLNLAHMFKTMGLSVLIVDLDVYCGGIALSLNLKYDNDMFSLFNDINNHQMSMIQKYITSYQDNISVLPAPKDPRSGSKMTGKFIEQVLEKVETLFDVILIDTNHILSEINLVALDKSDKIAVIFTNDPVGLTNTKSLLSIFKDAQLDNYITILNNSSDINKDYFNNFDIKNLLKNNIDFTIPDSFYDKNIDKIVLAGEILIASKTNRKALKNFDTIANNLLKEVDR